MPEIGHKLELCINSAISTIVKFFICNLVLYCLIFTLGIHSKNTSQTKQFYLSEIFAIYHTNSARSDITLCNIID